PVYSNHLFIPMPILGLFGFFLLLFFTIFAQKHAKLLYMRRFAAFTAFLFSIYLMSYMFIIVRNLCPLCTLSFFLSLCFAALELIELERKKLRITASLLTIIAIIVIFGVFLVSKHYNPQEVFNQNNEKFLTNVKTLDADYRAVSRASDKPIVVYIYSCKCKFCMYYTSEVLNADKVENALRNYRIFKLNISSNNEFLKSIETKVNQVPTLVIWARNKELQYLRGVKSVNRVVEFLQQENKSNLEEQ
ncbi:MAG: hypothetical protein K8S87_06985, partial [Planctomycetes bacterium]|nr:hypothetical protein [Planctomycetota bacterium]